MNRQFFYDLFGGPFPGHGVRVNVPGPADVKIISQGTVEKRARMGRQMYLWEQECAQIIGDDRVPMAHVWSGTDVFAAAYGSAVHRPADNMPFALPAVTDAQEADRLTEPDMGVESLREVFALADQLADLCGPDVPLRIFDIQSPFDIGALIWQKENYFCALVETPEAIHRLLVKITRTVAAAVGAFKKRYPQACLVHFPELWLPSDWGICLSEDDSGSISARHFRAFCLPYLQELARSLGGISIHCCADGQHQWQEFLKLPGLRYLNLFHPPTDLEAAITTFSGRAVLVPGPHSPAGGTFNGHEEYIDMVRDCLRLARPGTRFFFVTEAPDLQEARRLAQEIKSLCGRSGREP